MPFYVGTYTNETSKGIYRLTLDPRTGRLSDPVLAAEAANPSFLAWHPSRPIVYGVSETSSGPERAGFVMAFAVQADGSLKKINEQPSGGFGAVLRVGDPVGIARPGRQLRRRERGVVRRAG